jgi:hypothetical protein
MNACSPLVGSLKVWITRRDGLTISQRGPVNAFTTRFVGTTDGSFTPFNVLSNPFPSGIIHNV